MKFPSVKYLASQAQLSAKRFSLPLLFALTGTYFALLLVDDSHKPLFVRILYTCILGLPLSLGCMTYAERSSKPLMKIIMPALAICFSLAYWHWWAPGEYFVNYRQMLLFFVLAIIMHLWVAIAPYIRHNERTGFWRFNETMYARMILSLAFSAALFIGLSLAFTACKILLKFDISSDIYFRLWIQIMGIFNTWFFLAGIPADYTEVNTEKIFPKTLKIFTQYILIPIVTIYMVILYVYGIKIIGMWSLPKGWVSTLIFCYSMVGILAVLLVNPLSNDKDTPWVHLFSRFFFIASLPLVVLLYTAIYTRVSHYGITESRYYLMLLGGWLGCISLYFIFSAQKNIRIIPLTLAIIGLLSLFGPWSVFSVAQKSQMRRLERILTKNNIWKPGEKITASKKIIGNKYDAEQVDNIIEYLIDRGNVMALQPMFAANIKDLVIYSRYNTSGSYDWEAKNKLKDTLVNIISTNKVNGMTRYRDDLDFTSDTHTGINISGYSKIFYFSHPYYPDNKKQWIYVTPTDSLQVTLAEEDSNISFHFFRDGKIVEKVDLNGFIKGLDGKQNHEALPQQEMTIAGSGIIKPLIIIRRIQIKDPGFRDNDNTVQQLDAWILIK